MFSKQLIIIILNILIPIIIIIITVVIFIMVRIVKYVRNLEKRQLHDEWIININHDIKNIDRALILIPMSLFTDTHTLIHSNSMNEINDK